MTNTIGSDNHPAAPLDQELAPALASIPDLSTISVATLPRIRELMAGAPLDTTASDLLEVELITASSQGHNVNGILYRPRRQAPARAAILNLHGGGYIAGTARREDGIARTLARDLDVVVFSLEYRLAPEAPYPAALDDCYAALAWLHEQAAELGIDRNRIAVRGVSAGGGLAVGLALLARDRSRFNIAFLALLYPMIDDRTPAHPFNGRHIWPIEANRFAWNCYLGDVAGRSEVPHYGAPARANDLRGLPPTFIGVGSIDLFADENIRFAQQLMGAGIATELHVYPGAFHGFNLITTAAVARAYAADMHRAFERALSSS